MSRKVCVNVPNATYSGKEFSPMHFGLSAEGYEINTIMEGFDKQMWCVKVKNNKKVWIRHTIGANKLVHEDPITTEKEMAEYNEKQKTFSEQKKEEVKKEEKKITDYNMFLTYRLNELKKDNTDKKKNKELFDNVITEWKELKKNPTEFAITIDKARMFLENSKK